MRLYHDCKYPSQLRRVRCLVNCDFASFLIGSSSGIFLSLCQLPNSVFYVAKATRGSLIFSIFLESSKACFPWVCVLPVLILGFLLIIHLKSHLFPTHSWIPPDSFLPHSTHCLLTSTRFAYLFLSPTLPPACGIGVSQGQRFLCFVRQGIVNV